MAVTDLRTLREALDTLERSLPELAPESLPALLADLERLRAMAYMGWLGGSMVNAPASGAPTEGDHLLDVGAAAKKLAVSKDWLYRNASRLPFTVRLGSKHLRFRSVGIDAYLRQRAGRGDASA